MKTFALVIPVGGLVWFLVVEVVQMYAAVETTLQAAIR